MDTPSEPDMMDDSYKDNGYKYVTVGDLQELLQRVGQQRIYRRHEEGELEAARYAERYLSAVRRFIEAKEKSEQKENDED